MISRLIDLDFKFALIRNSLFVLLSWIVFFPGFFSSDSFGAIQMAKSGNLGNSFTATWAIYVRVLSLHGNAIGLLTLLGGLLLVFATTQFAYSVFTKKTAAISSFILTLTPLIWGMGNTLWHDIQMTSGMLLLASFMVKIHNSQKVTPSEIGIQLILGSVLLSFRPNGLPTLIVFALFFSLLVRKKFVLRYLLVGVSTTLLTTFIASNLILGLSPINTYFAQEWMRNDISCFANSPNGVGFVEKNLPNIGNTETWKSQAACTFLNQASITGEEKVEAEALVPSAWITLLMQDPMFVLDTHLKRNSYLVPMPLNGFPEPPFLHSTIEFQGMGVEWAFPSLAEEVRAPMRLWNALRSITAWAGLWCAITLILLTRFKKNELFAPFLMSLSLLGVLFVFAPIPDGRYALFALIVGQMALLGKMVEWAQTGSNRRPTD